MDGGNAVAAFVSNVLTGGQQELSTSDLIRYLQALQCIAEHQTTSASELKLPDQFKALDLIGRSSWFYGRSDVDELGVLELDELRMARLRFSRGGTLAERDGQTFCAVLERLCQEDVLLPGDNPGTYRLPPTEGPSFADRGQAMCDKFLQQLQGLVTYRKPGSQGRRATPAFDPQAQYAHLVMHLQPAPNLNAAQKSMTLCALRFISLVGLTFDFAGAQSALVKKEGGKEFRRPAGLRKFLVDAREHGWVTEVNAPRQFGRARTYAYQWHLDKLPVVIVDQSDEEEDDGDEEVDDD